MKTVLATSLLALLLTGCATKCQKRVNALEKNTVEAFENVVNGMTTQAQMNENVNNGQNEFVVILFNEIQEIKAFIADRNKRWPPPVKLKGHK